MAEPRLRWNVLVVDDSQAFLDAACTWMATRPELRVVGTARNGLRALEDIERLRPDLVLIDAVMPELDGFETTRRVKQQPGAPWVVIVSLHGSETVRREAWIAGADGFVPKAELIENLPGIVRDLASEAAGTRDGSRGAGAPGAIGRSRKRGREKVSEPRISGGPQDGPSDA